MAYTDIDNGEEHFQILHYTGNGSTSSGITRTFDGSVNLKPGLMYTINMRVVETTIILWRMNTQDPILSG